MQNFVSLVLLGGTGFALLGGCLVQASGAVLFALAGIAIFFGVGFVSQLQSLRKQG